MARTSTKRSTASSTRSSSSRSSRTKSASGSSTRSTGAARGRSSRASTTAKRTTTRGRSASSSSSSKRKLSKSSRPHKMTTSGHPIFEPIDMTPTERKEAGEKLPAYIKNTGKPWQPEEVKELKALAKGNTPTRVIGMKLGRSESSIRAKARGEEISLKPANRSPYGTRS